MTRSVRVAAILHGRVDAFWTLSNRSGTNLCWMVIGLMQLARQENFSRQSACSRQFRVWPTTASQWTRAALSPKLYFPPWPNCNTPNLKRNIQSASIFIWNVQLVTVRHQNHGLVICSRRLVWHAIFLETKRSHVRHLTYFARISHSSIAVSYMTGSYRCSSDNASLEG